MQIVFKMREGFNEQAEPLAKSAVKDLLPPSDMKDVSVRQLFPGLDKGQRARLFILEVRDGLLDQKIAEAVRSLRSNDAVEYAEIPAARRPL